MNVPVDRLDPAEAASLLNWWLEAGVDLAIAEAPRDWSAVAVKVAETKPRSDPTPQAAMPEDFAAFREWIASAGGLPLDGPGTRRVLPHGDEGAAVMLLSETPSRDDAVDGRPIGGDAWQLTEKMLAAIGLASADAYSASLACFHAPGGKLDANAIKQCGDIARAHIRSAKPQRLLLFGDGPAKALLGEPLARARGRVHTIEGVRTVATYHPRWLMQRPGDKALAWRDLLLLASDEA